MYSIICKHKIFNNWASVAVKHENCLQTAIFKVFFKARWGNFEERLLYSASLFISLCNRLSDLLSLWRTRPPIEGILLIFLFDFSGVYPVVLKYINKIK
jgi:hypothetical protein